MSCGSKYYRPMRQGRKIVIVTTALCFLIAGGVFLLIWRAGSNESLEELKRMLLRIGKS